MTTGDGANDFEIASQLAGLLKGVAKERQHKILRWVAEDIGMPLFPAPGGGPGPAPPPPGPGPGQGGEPPGHTANIKSFVESKSPKSDMQFAAVVAYYYRFEAPVDERRDTISAETLQDAARLANRERPASPAQTLLNAKGQGYLDTVSRGQYRINSVGENLVAMALPGTATTTASARTRSRTKKSGRKTMASKASGRTRQKKVAPRTARR